MADRPMIQTAGVQQYISDHADVINAVAIFAATLAVAKLVDRLIKRNATRVTGKVVRDELSQSAVTRLRLLRRLLAALIVVVGLALALEQIDALKTVSNLLLASSAVVGIAVGLAARGTLANGVAGVMLATVQPFRIGDVIEWNGSRGRVEDITLTYTFIRLPSGHRLVVPNDTIATTPVENYTIAGGSVDADASVWVSPRRANTALSLLRESMPEVDVHLGECHYEGIELKLGFTTDAHEEATRRIAMREQAVGLLGDAGMLDAPAQ